MTNEINWLALLKVADEYAESDNSSAPLSKGASTEEPSRDSQIEQIRHTLAYGKLDEEFRQETGEEVLTARAALKRELISEVHRNPFAYLKTDENPAGLIHVNEDGTVDDAQVEALVQKSLLPWAESAIAQASVARALRRAEAHGEIDPPAPTYNLTNFLKADIDPLRLRVNGMSIAEGTMLISAEYKVGKSTFMMNLMKSLADSEDFLGMEVSPLGEGRSIVYWDLEQVEAYTQSQFSKMGIKNTDVIYPYNGRGRGIDILNEEFQKDAIRILRDLSCEILVIDTFTQAFDGEENSNSEQREWFKGLDKIVKLAGVSDLIIVGHMGHGMTRQRGASFLAGHVDNIVTVTRVSSDDSDTTRKVTIEGRGVEKHSLHYTYDGQTNLIQTIAEPTNLNSRTKDENKEAIFKYIVDHGPSSAYRVRQDTGKAHNTVKKALDSLLGDGLIHVQETNGAKYYESVTLQPSSDRQGDMPKVEL